MLLIRRRAGESILIGEDIEIQIVDLTPSRVKIGITAPREVVVLRKEVKLSSEQNIAASVSLNPVAVERLLQNLVKPGEPAGR
jgi:carbon storage regulator